MGPVVAAALQGSGDVPAGCSEGLACPALSAEQLLLCLQITLLKTPGEQLNSFAFFGLGHHLSKAIFSCCSRALWLKLVFTWYNDTFVAGFLSLHIHTKNTHLTLQTKLYKPLLVLVVGVTLNLQEVTWDKFS